MIVKQPIQPDAKILVLDIEWRPVMAYVWRAWKENIRPGQIVEDGGLLCVGVKWLGDKETMVFSEWEHGHFGMLMMTHAMMSEADAIVTYNGDKYDLPKLNGEFLLHGLNPLPPVASIDCIKQVKKFGFFQNNLAYIGPFLRLGGKQEHEGFGLWKKVMGKDPDAEARMTTYCKQDVDLTEALYMFIRPFMVNHPHLGEDRGTCPNCGGHHLQARGTRRTRMFAIQRLHCQDCGAWSSGTRHKI